MQHKLVTTLQIQIWDMEAKQSQHNLSVYPRDVRHLRSYLISQANISSSSSMISATWKVLMHQVLPIAFHLHRVQRDYERTAWATGWISDLNIFKVRFAYYEGKICMLLWQHRHSLHVLNGAERAVSFTKRVNNVSDDVQTWQIVN